MYLVGDFIPQDLNPICKDLADGEVVLANLEGPVCADDIPPASKVGIHLHSRSFSVPGRFAFALANNHLMDFGSDGLHQTVAFLAEQNILSAGAGDTVETSRTPMLFEENGKRIAVFSCCERQFGVSDVSRVGVAEKGLWLLNAIKDVKQTGRADYVVVSCHAASEFSPFVNPDLREFYHMLIDNGVDVVHGHHSHVPQGVEYYGKGFIAYGLGNFLVKVDDWAGKNCNWSNVVHLIVGEERLSVDWVRPYQVTRDGGNAISCAVVDSDWLAELLQYNERVNRQCSDDVMCRAIWQEASVRLYHRIYEQLLRAPSVVSVRLSLRDRIRKLYFGVQDFVKILLGRECPNGKSMKYAMGIFNYFNCESHVDTIRTALGVLTGSAQDLRTSETARIAKECGL